MEAKKKLIVALTSLCGVMFAAIVAMGIVWAATSQTVTSNVKVTYTATEVSGSIAGNVYFNSDNATAMTAALSNGSDGTVSDNVISFNGEASSISGTLTPSGNVELLNETGKTFVIFEYIITNSSTTTAMTATLSYTDDSTSPNVADSNIKVYAYSATAQVSNPHTNVATLKGSNEGNLTSNSGQLISATVAASGTTYFYVVVAVDNLASDAEFSGIFSWNMTKYTAPAQQGGGE